MALKKTISLKNNFGLMSEIPDCYVRVDEIRGGKTALAAKVAFCSADKQHRYGIKAYDFFPSLDGANFIRQAYEHLKTLPEFAGAVDC